MSTKRILIQKICDGVFQLRLSDEEGRNRLDPSFCQLLSEALTDLAAKPDLRTLVLSGLPEVFCAGASLETLQNLAEGAIKVRDSSLPEQLLSFPLPVVADLEGHAVGGGLVLALCCDVRVAARGQRYGLNFSTLGLTPGMGATTLLPALIGHGFASEMLMTGRFYLGEELEQRGIFNYVMDASEVGEKAIDLARQIADGKPRDVLRLIKEALALPRQAALREAIGREDQMHQICFQNPETADLIRRMYLSD